MIEKAVYQVVCISFEESISKDRANKIAEELAQKYEAEGIEVSVAVEEVTIDEDLKI